MKISCQIIKDLLPLYHDGACSPESAAIVEEHLEECESCKRELQIIDNEITAPSHLEEAAPFKAVRDKLTKSKKKAIIKGALISALIFAVICGLFCSLTMWKCIPVSTDVLKVSDVSRLADGRIVYHLEVTDHKELREIRFSVNKDGSFYMTPKRSVITLKQTGENFSDYYLIDLDEDNEYQKKFGDGIEIKAYYLGNEKDNILIWKDGMNLPQASAEVEKIIENEW